MNQAYPFRADVEQSEEDKRATSWLSRGLEALVALRPSMATDGIPAAFDFDVVIVGSGYGASVAAAELAGCRDAAGRPISVCVLERGNEYLPGMFPSRMADLSGHVRFATPDAKKAKGVLDGLFDVRSSGDAMAVVANGLGGGSLINAGVMEMPLDAIFREERWPQAIRQDESLESLATDLRTRLGAKTVDRTLPKTAVMQKLAGGKGFKLAEVTIASGSGPNNARVELDQCLDCGDCATGCNHNAKDSLDVNLLHQAKAAGAQVFTGATVLRVECVARAVGAEPGWVLHINHTDGHLRDRQPTPFRLLARRVILAAGTLGSTEILMRSRCDALQLSDQLGRKFSANGDMIATVHDVQPLVNAVADETVAPEDRARGIGPTITSMIDLRQGMAETDLVIQDMAIPGPLRRLFEESTTTSDVLNRLADGDRKDHDGRRTHPDDAAVDPAAMKKSLVVAMMGRDNADGELTAGGRHLADDADGLLTVRWPELRNDPRFEAHHDTLGQLGGVPGLGGRVISNLMWRPLSSQLERVFGRQRGPLVTVHPLGGCAMGDSVRTAVTDHCGRVFDAGSEFSTDTYDGLVVLDGSIVPCSLGINPALTIAVLALRAVRRLKAEWQFGPVPPVQVTGSVTRPRFCTPKTIVAPNKTEIELTEQMRGPVCLRMPNGFVQECIVEITLTSEPVALDALMTRETGEAGRKLTVARAGPGELPKGRLRILSKKPDAISDEPAAGEVLLEAKISGSLHVFALGRSNVLCRRLRALWAWFRNRGLRDIAQAMIALGRRLVGLQAPAAGETESLWSAALDNVRAIWQLCSRAGAVRLIEYELRIDEIKPVEGPPVTGFDGDAFRGRAVRGTKHLTYARCASPWTQLMEMSLEEFPNMVVPGCDAPRLSLNPRYLARQQVPLFRLVGQQDHVAAIVDLLSFVLYAMRVVLQIHALSFRKPDRPSSRPAARLPGLVPGLPKPRIDWLPVVHSDNVRVNIRLARYHDDKKAKEGGTAGDPPVMLIHGYSASGTTFAHPAVPNGLAKTLFDAGRDVWVLDMRSSSGMPTARDPWAFEDMAQVDIPVAVEHVLGATGAKKLDVVAHCMGAAMFGMAVLAETDRHLNPNTLHEKVNRLVMSQIGPAMILSPANLLRAYVMRYVRQYLPLGDYAFSPEGEISLGGQLLDRLLATLPMPADEYQRENPMCPPGKETPWVSTRHRMDALYASTFKLSNLSDEVLDCIDDFFGPLSIQTVSQVIHFARVRAVTDRQGVNHYIVDHERVADRMSFPMLSIHGEENGLSDVATLEHMRRVLEDAGVPYLNALDSTGKWQTKQQLQALIQSKRESKDLRNGKASFMTWRIANHGHQDCLIGTQAGENCEVIADFLSSHT